MKRNSLVDYRFKDDEEGVRLTMKTNNLFLLLVVQQKNAIVHDHQRNIINNVEHNRPPYWCHEVYHQDMLFGACLLLWRNFSETLKDHRQMLLEQTKNEGFSCITKFKELVSQMMLRLDGLLQLWRVKERSNNSFQLFLPMNYERDIKTSNPRG